MIVDAATTGLKAGSPDEDGEGSVCISLANIFPPVGVFGQRFCAKIGRNMVQRQGNNSLMCVSMTGMEQMRQEMCTQMQTMHLEPSFNLMRRTGVGLDARMCRAWRKSQLWLDIEISTGYFRNTGTGLYRSRFRLRPRLAQSAERIDSPISRSAPAKMQAVSVLRLICRQRGDGMQYSLKRRREGSQSRLGVWFLCDRMLNNSVTDQTLNHRRGWS